MGAAGCTPFLPPAPKECMVSTSCLLPSLGLTALEVFSVSSPPEFLAYIQVPHGRVTPSCTLLGEGTGAEGRGSERAERKGPFQFPGYLPVRGPQRVGPGPEATFPGVAAPSLPVLRGLWREAWGPLGSLQLRRLQRHLCCVQGVPHASRSHLSPHLECPLPLHTHHCPHSPCGLLTLKISLKGASSNHIVETCPLQETNRSVYFLPSICHYQARFCLIICLLSDVSSPHGDPQIGAPQVKWFAVSLTLLAAPE